jgi:hypothetical protein
MDNPDCFAPGVAEPASPPSAAALRMRAFRRRRRTGSRCVQIQIGPREIDRLIAKGYLGPQEREDLEGIGAAASWFLAEALLGPAT